MNFFLVDAACLAVTGALYTHNMCETIPENKEGMLSLAKQLISLAEGAPGDHIHYDEYSSLETGSAEMIIEKMG